ncbi:MAG: hypothetical protein WC614_12660 [bacterium]
MTAKQCFSKVPPMEASFIPKLENSLLNGLNNSGMFSQVDTFAKPIKDKLLERTLSKKNDFLDEKIDSSLLLVGELVHFVAEKGGRDYIYRVTFNYEIISNKNIIANGTIETSEKIKDVASSESQIAYFGPIIGLFTSLKDMDYVTKYMLSDLNNKLIPELKNICDGKARYEPINYDVLNSFDNNYKIDTKNYRFIAQAKNTLALASGIGWYLYAYGGGYLQNKEKILAATSLGAFVFTDMELGNFTYTGFCTGVISGVVLASLLHSPTSDTYYGLLTVPVLGITGAIIGSKIIIEKNRIKILCTP